MDSRGTERTAHLLEVVLGGMRGIDGPRARSRSGRSCRIWAPSRLGLARGVESPFGRLAVVLRSSRREILVIIACFVGFVRCWRVCDNEGWC